MLNFLLHQILNETSLNMDGYKKMDCGAVKLNGYKATVWRVGEVKLSSYLCKKPSFHCQCAIRHGPGSGCNLGQSKEPSSAVKATSSEMPCRRKRGWHRDKSAPMQGLETATRSLLPTKILRGGETMSWSQSVWVKLGLRAFKVSIYMTLLGEELVLRFMERMRAQDDEGGETRSQLRLKENP